jgi:hypothetical protein
MSAKLPTGPPQIPLVIRFTSRELEYIELRYGQTRGYKEIAAMWNLSIRYVRSLGSMVYIKLNLQCTDADTYTLHIRALKKLIALGYVKLEGEQ